MPLPSGSAAKQVPPAWLSVLLLLLLHLQGVQSFTEACARLELDSQRDSLLRNLNHLCITLDELDVMSEDGSTASGALIVHRYACGSGWAGIAHVCKAYYKLRVGGCLP